MNINKKRMPKLSREKWLELAIEALAEKCKSKFSLDSLIAAMPVTKGSFYSHFKNRSDFLLALVDFWDRHDTQSVVQALEHLPEDLSPQDRLWELTQAIHDLQLCRYELLLRVISFEYPETRDAVARVDLRRIEVVRDLFAAMGYEGMECEMRTRVYVTAISQELSILSALPEEQRMQFCMERHLFFTQPRAEVQEITGD